MLRGSHVVISSNLRVRNDGLPVGKQAQPQDKGVAVYFLRKGKQMVFACDRWDKVEDNIHAIALTIEAIRGVERWGASEMMERAFSAFEALPAPLTCWQILGVNSGSSEAEIRAAWLAKVKASHPDRGGSTERTAELNRARDEALRASKP